MRKIYARILSMVAAVALSGAAYAADMAVKAPPAAPIAPPVYNWTGIYMGGSIGWMQSTLGWDYANPVPVTCCVPISPKFDEAVVGLHIGA
jgi:opacity protein-like surface antigen